MQSLSFSALHRDRGESSAEREILHVACTELLAGLAKTFSSDFAAVAAVESMMMIWLMEKVEASG